MNNLESLFRWAIYHDYGTSPEQLAQNMRAYTVDTIRSAKTSIVDTLETINASKYSVVTGCSIDQIKHSHFVLSISEFLARFQSDIISSGRSEGIDATAIAAVITWEFEKNLKGRLSDYFQTIAPGDTSGVGWGSMHTQEALKLSSDKSLREISCIRMDAKSVIPLVAKFIKNCVDEYYKESGIYIGNDPVVMAFFYNTGISKARESARKRKNEVPDIPNSSQVIHLNVTVNPMAKWVKNNLNQFTKFYTTPSVPNNVKAYAVAK